MEGPRVCIGLSSDSRVIGRDQFNAIARHRGHFRREFLLGSASKQRTGLYQSNVSSHSDSINEILSFANASNAGNVSPDSTVVVLRMLFCILSR
jgi:hypothetical protein